MRLRFTKMHGAGNDFVMVDGVSHKVNLTPDMVKRIADRNFGVGCDQVLLVEPPRTPEADFRYRIFNQDGGEVENCGNGARCFAIFAHQRGLTKKRSIIVETAGGQLILKVGRRNNVTVDMGVPVLAPQKIPFDADQQSVTYTLSVGETQFDISAVSMGNPHAVTLVDDVDTFAVEKYGPLLESHSAFPNRVNAGFLQVLSRQEGKLRVYERGVGETLACGTGACAALVAGQLNGLFDKEVNLLLPGGRLTLSWEGNGKPVMMTGPAESVFQGQIKL